MPLYLLPLQRTNFLESPCKSKRDPFSQWSSGLGGMITSHNPEKEQTWVSMCVTGLSGESGVKRMFALERAKPRELSQCLSMSVIPIMWFWPLSLVILGWELRNKQRKPQIADHFGNSLQKKISPEMSSTIAQECHSNISLNAENDDCVSHQHIRTETHSGILNYMMGFSCSPAEQSQGKRRGPPKVLSMGSEVPSALAAWLGQNVPCKARQEQPVLLLEAC